MTSDLLSARGHEAWAAEYRTHGQANPRSSASGALALRLNSNENPLGPSFAARVAIERALRFSGRYPMNASPATADFRTLVAQLQGVAPESVALGAGSGEILDSAVRAFTSPRRGLASGLPTFEAPVRLAREIKVPVTEILVDRTGKLDLEKLAAAAAGAGLVYICNPNNPTAAVHSFRAIADFAGKVWQTSPDTVVLIDEAYHDYVMDPAYSTAVPLVPQYRNVIVSRTLSKLHGMAGMRLGYVIGQCDTIERLARWTMPFNGNVLAIAAACVSLRDHPQIERERRRNREALQYTTDYFRGAGLWTSESQTNFLWVDLKRPAKDFREACEAQGVLVGREFPPFDETHCRISIGTIEEMGRAVAVFRSILRT
jgi:histidinol-phosphate aminotransferase